MASSIAVEHPSPSFSATLRVRLENHPGAFASLATAIADAGGLLDAIEGRDYDVFSSRVRLSTCRKLCLLLQALPVRWGWT